MSLTPKRNFLSGTTYNSYCAWGYVLRCDLLAWWRKKRTETFRRQTGYLPKPPTL